MQICYQDPIILYIPSLVWPATPLGKSTQYNNYSMVCFTEILWAYFYCAAHGHIASGQEKYIISVAGPGCMAAGLH